MKSRFGRFSLFAVTLLIAVFSVSALVLNFTDSANVSAQEAPEGNTKDKKSLAYQMGRLADALEQFLKQDDPDEPVQPEGFSLQTTYNYINPKCMEDYESLPSSTTYKINHDWDLSFYSFVGSSSTLNTFLDVNGDGILDYIYRWISQYDYAAVGSDYINGGKTCIFLGNGAGWDKTYQCHITFPTINGVKTPTFYGDCADMS